MSTNLLIIEYGGGGERPVPAGQERLAIQSELDAISELLQRHEAIRLGVTGERRRQSTHQESSAEHSNGYFLIKPPLITNRMMTDGEGGETNFSPEMSSEEVDSPIENGGGINRFLLCTIVWSVAREVKARGDANGERLSVPQIARDLLRSYLRAGSQTWQYLPDEKSLEDEIKRRLQ